MKIKTQIIILFFVIFSFNYAKNYAQESELFTLTEAEQKSYTDLQNRIEEYEKQVLKNKVEEINILLRSGEIKLDEANNRKKAASELAAQNIKDLNEILAFYTSYKKRNTNKMDLSEIDFSDMDFDFPLTDLSDFFVELGDYFKDLQYKSSEEYDYIKQKRKELELRRKELNQTREELQALRQEKIKQESNSMTSEENNDVYSSKTISKRTDGFLIMAIGFNNAAASGASINNTDYRFGGSRSFEIGYARSTRVFNNSDWLRLVYGFSFQFNGLKPEGNRIFVNNNGVTELEEFDFNLSKNKFRMDNFIVPVHFEMGSSRKKTYDNGKVYYGDRDFKVGLGGFVGINLTTLQKLKYRNENDRRVKDKLKSGYNTNNILYGLSAYIGWEEFSFYAQYNLNPIFENNPVDIHNFQLGVRFDLY